MSGGEGSESVREIVGRCRSTRSGEGEKGGPDEPFQRRVLSETLSRAESFDASNAGRLELGE